MPAEFDWIVLEKFGSSPHIDGKQSGKVSISLDLGEGAQFYPEVAIDVLVDKRPDVTWGEIEEQARLSAIEHLQTALTALQGSSLDQLRTTMLERRAAQEAARTAAFEASLGSALSSAG